MKFRPAIRIATVLTHAHCDRTPVRAGTCSPRAYADAFNEGTVPKLHEIT